MKRLLPLLTFFFLTTAFNDAKAFIKADKVIVHKSKHLLFLFKNETVIKKYHVVFGGNPKGHKQKEGDQKTPEGKYILDYKKSDSAYHKAIHISYPNPKDKERAAAHQYNPGGMIMIHGQKNHLGWLYFLTQNFNWTDGCIALSNKDMDELWDYVDVDTEIEIIP